MEEDKLRSFLGQKRLMDGEVVECVKVGYEVVLEGQETGIRRPYVTYIEKGIIHECYASRWEVAPLAPSEE